MRGAYRIFWIDYRIWIVIFIGLFINASVNRRSEARPAIAASKQRVAHANPTDSLRTFGESFEQELRSFGLDNWVLVDSSHVDHARVCRVCIQSVVSHLSQNTFVAPAEEILLNRECDWLVMYLPSLDIHMAVVNARHRDQVKRVICSARENDESFEVTAIGSFSLSKDDGAGTFPTYARYVRKYHPDRVQK